MESRLMNSAILVGLVILFAGIANAKNRFIVTFKSTAGFNAMARLLVFESAENNIRVQKPLHNLHAMIISSASQASLNILKNHPEVSSIQEEVFFPKPKPVFGFKPTRLMVLKNSNRQFGPSDSRNTNTFSGTPVLQIGPKTPWGIEAVHAGAAWARSDAGSQARVLVLDTGIDAGHQDLQGNFEQGRNFYEGESGVAEPGDYKDEEGHGTHVSGTIAGGYDSQSGFTGVAPKAKLLMGRVCGTLGCSSLALVEGIDWGIGEKVDVINMSLGGAMGNAATKEAVLEAEKAGVVVVAASGNDGTAQVSYPAAFSTVIAVGALDSSLTKTEFSQWGPELDIMAPGSAVVSSVPRGTGRDSIVSLVIGDKKRAVLSAAFSGTKLIPNVVINSLVDLKLGKPEDFKNVDVKGKFALVSRGEIRFSEKIHNAFENKAAGVVIYNTVAGVLQGVATDDGSVMDFPVVMIEHSEGQRLLEALAKGEAVAAEIQTSASDYSMFDGTSMAAPHVAGVVALIKSANKKLTPAQVRSILSTSAKKLGPNTMNEYGAGLVQADTAVQAALQL